MSFFNVRVLPINPFHLVAEFQPLQRVIECVGAPETKCAIWSRSVVTAHTCPMGSTCSITCTSYIIQGISQRQAAVARI